MRGRRPYTPCTRLPLPPEYATLGEEATRARIHAAKAALGDRLVILGHHYQRDEIIEHADFRGDSYKLAKGRRRPARRRLHRVLRRPPSWPRARTSSRPTTRRVILPNLAAGCSMADMANLFQVRNAWRDLTEKAGIAPRG